MNPKEHRQLIEEWLKSIGATDIYPSEGGKHRRLNYTWKGQKLYELLSRGSGSLDSRATENSLARLRRELGNPEPTTTQTTRRRLEDMLPEPPDTPVNLPQLALEGPESEPGSPPKQIAYHMGKMAIYLSNNGRLKFFVPKLLGEKFIKLGNFARVRRLTNPDKWVIYHADSGSTLRPGKDYYEDYYEIDVSSFGLVQGFEPFGVSESEYSLENGDITAYPPAHFNSIQPKAPRSLAPQRLEEPPQDFQARIRFLVSQSGLTAIQVAERLGVSPQTVYQWKAGRSNPSPASWANISKTFPKELEAFGAPILAPPAQTGIQSAIRRRVLEVTQDEEAAKPAEPTPEPNATDPDWLVHWLIENGVNIQNIKSVQLAVQYIEEKAVNGLRFRLVRSKEEGLKFTATIE